MAYRIWREKGGCLPIYHNKLISHFVTPLTFFKNKILVILYIFAVTFLHNSFIGGLTIVWYIRIISLLSFIVAGLTVAKGIYTV